MYLHSEVSRLFGGFRSAMTQMLDEFKNSKPKIWVFRSTWSIMIPIRHCFRFPRSVRATYCNSLALFLPVLTPSASQCKALEHITDVLPQSIRMQNSVWCCNPQSGWIHSLVFVCVWLCVVFCKKLALTPVAVENMARRPVPKSHVFVLPVVDPNKPKAQRLVVIQFFAWCMKARMQEWHLAKQPYAISYR